MSSPCYGNELALNNDYCLTVANAKAATPWPYSGTPQSQANGLCTDPNSGLWVAPRSPLAGSYHHREQPSPALTSGTWGSGNPATISKGSTVTIPFPTGNCLSYGVFITASYAISGTFNYTDVYTWLSVGLNVSGGPIPVPDNVAMESSSEQSAFGTQTYSMNGTSHLYYTSAVGAAQITVPAYWIMNWGSKSNIAATQGPTVNDWSIDMVWVMFPLVG